MKNFQLCSGCFYFVFNVSNADITWRMTDITVLFLRDIQKQKKNISLNKFQVNVAGDYTSKLIKHGHFHYL